MEDAPKMSRLLEGECPIILIRIPRSRSPKPWYNMADPVVPLERHLYGHPPAELLWERKLAEVLLEEGWVRIPGWEV